MIIYLEHITHEPPTIIAFAVIVGILLAVVLLLGESLARLFKKYKDIKDE